MMVHNCIVSGNSTDGAVLNNLPTSTMAIVNSTVQGNTSFGQAGGIENGGTLTIL